MTTDPNSANFSNGTGCEVCGAELSKVEIMRKGNKNYGVCSSVECKTVMEQQAWMAPAMFQPHLIFQRKLILERRQVIRDREDHIKSIKAAEEQENHDLLKSMLGNAQEKVNPTVQALGIPSAPTELTPPNTDRIAQYKAHLKHVIADAARHDKASDVVQDQHYNAYEMAIDVEQRLSSNTKLRSLSDKLCTLCQGGCCSEGGNHSFIRTITIRRYMDLNPALTQSEIFDSYTTFLNEKTIDGSCINHAEKGCTLPRTLRSDVCNGFYCDSLKSYQAHPSSGEVMSVLAIQRSNTNASRFDPEIENTVIKIELVEVQ